MEGKLDPETAFKRRSEDSNSPASLEKSPLSDYQVVANPRIDQV